MRTENCATLFGIKDAGAKRLVFALVLLASLPLGGGRLVAQTLPSENEQLAREFLVETPASTPPEGVRKTPTLRADVDAFLQRSDVVLLRDASEEINLRLRVAETQLTSDTAGAFFPVLAADDGHANSPPRAYLYYHRHENATAPPVLLFARADTDNQGRPYVELQVPGSSTRFTWNGTAFEASETEDSAGVSNLATTLALRVAPNALEWGTVKGCLLDYLGVANLSQIAGRIDAFCTLSELRKDVLTIVEHGVSCAALGLVSCGYFAAHLVEFLGCGAASVVSCVNGTQNTETQLGNGQSLSNQNVAEGAWKYYWISVPSGKSSLKVTITGSGGDADLYTRFNSKPTSSVYTCRPYQGGSNETCRHSNPAKGKWWIGVRGYAASRFTVKAEY